MRCKLKVLVLLLSLFCCNLHAHPELSVNMKVQLKLVLVVWSQPAHQDLVNIASVIQNGLVQSSAFLDDSLLPQTLGIPLEYGHPPWPWTFDFPISLMINMELNNGSLSQQGSSHFPSFLWVPQQQLEVPALNEVSVLQGEAASAMVPTLRDRNLYNQRLQIVTVLDMMRSLQRALTTVNIVDEGASAASPVSSLVISIPVVSGSQMVFLPTGNTESSLLPSALAIPGVTVEEEASAAGSVWPVIISMPLTFEVPVIITVPREERGTLTITSPDAISPLVLPQLINFYNQVAARFGWPSLQEE